MLISLKELPLVASHLVCLFLGAALSNMTHESCSDLVFSPHKALIPIKESQFRMIEVKRVYSSQRVMLIRYDNKKMKPDCLETEKPAKIRIINDSYYVETSKSSSSFYWKLMSSKKKSVFLIPYDRALLFEVCQGKPEGTYGGF